LLLPPAPVHYLGLTLSPDGKSLFYVARSNSQNEASLFRLPLGGGIPEKIKDQIDSPVSFSPDWHSIAFVREDARRGKSLLVVCDLSLGTERELVSRNMPEYLDYPAWSPDGQSIASVTVTPQLRTINFVRISDGREFPLGTQPWGWVTQLSWMADGKSLMLAGRANGSSLRQIWQVAFPSGKAQPVTRDLDRYHGVGVSQSGQVLVSVQERKVADIWQLSASPGGIPTRITRGLEGYLPATWTREGKIVFHKFAAGRGDLWSIAADGTGERQVTRHGGTEPSACRKADSLVYLSDEMGTVDIWKCALDGSNARRVATNTDFSFPQCSPDGKWIIYTLAEGRSWPTLRRRSLEDGTTVELAPGRAFRPAISPDGTAIASFYSLDSASPQRPPDQIAVLSAQNGHVLTSFPMTTSTLIDAGLRWSPDGRGVAYADMRNGTANLWFKPLDGTPSTQITHLRGDRIFSFDWSPDNRLILVKGVVARDLILITPTF
jgi:Tol biopolymer transport system component